MKTKIHTHETKAIKDFAIRKWKIADFEHYGTIPDWQSRHFLFEAKEQDKIVGILGCKVQLGVMDIEQVLVRKILRRQGIDKTLMREAEKFAKKLQVHKIHLITGEKWEAEYFYASLGFSKGTGLPHHFLKKDFVIYSKLL